MDATSRLWCWLPSQCERAESLRQDGETVGVVLERAGADLANEAAQNLVPARQVFLGLMVKRWRMHGVFLSIMVAVLHDSSTSRSKWNLL